MNRKGQWFLFINVGGVPRIGKLVKINIKTVWVRVMKGAKTNYVIKRHVKKHDLHLRFLED